ncbi:uncharacterized protein Dwil_GK27465 [Drosophila willistoni]|uniref:Uncharacterized protein n=1 Tax=Drosophila willistoni TaxID=7260 RepID=A0A0Q9X3U3_DROWI|nr:uncharacterized protein Dwil_GK27465 [Drosophila willistoni]
MNIAVKRLESYEDPVRARESNKHEHQIKSVKVKIKHHHHHHHHNHIKEVIKTVPKPYPVEKIVHIPFERIVEKIVHVPKILNVTLEKVVHVPVEKIVEKIIHIPKPVHIPKPYLIEKMVEKVVHVPKPFPVLRTVPYPVEIKVAAQEKLPIPFKMKAERKLIGYFNTKEPIKLKTFGQKNNNQTDDFKLNIEVENASNKKQYPVILPSDYIHNKIKFQNRNSTHHFNGIPLSVPIQLVPLQPKKYQSSIGFELDASDSS